MAQRSYELIAIETARDAQQCFLFWAVLDGPGGQVRAPVSAQSLLDYATFQREALTSCAIVYSQPACEGREAEFSNDLWRPLTGWHLNEAAARTASEGALTN
jgi:hypothetical protein